MSGNLSAYRAVLMGAAISAISLLSFQQAAVAAPPVEAFGSLPAIIEARISTDGKHLAIIRPDNGRPIVTVFQLDAPNAAPMVAGFPDAIATDIYWANYNRLVCTFRANLKQKNQFGTYQWVRSISVAMDGNPATVMMGDAPVQANAQSGVLGQDPNDPIHVVMQNWETDAQLHGDSPRLYDQNYLDLFKVNVVTGGADVIEHGATDTIRYLTDGMGHPLGRVDQTNDLTNHYFLGGKEFATLDARGGVAWDIEGLSQDGTQFVVTAFGKEGTRGLYGLKLGDSEPSNPVYVNPNYDIEHALFDDRTRRVSGVSYVDDKLEFDYFDPVLEKMEQKLERALPGQSVAIVSRDVPGANYVVVADGPKNPETYYLFSPATSQLSIVGSSYPGLTSADLGEEKPYPYKSLDGLDIHAYLTLPPGKAPKNLPVVIYPHGGPEFRDRLEFDFVAQFMASRGYAVLQPNFRGSSGYGGVFRDAGNGEWAGKVQDDITAGVKKLIADGIADPKRICIVGASYGGYAALAGATFHPELYACAISYAGISDAELFVDRITDYQGTHSESVSVWEARMGAKKSDSAKLDAISPYAHADQVKAPILLIHSTNDITVPIEQSETEESALKKAGKSVEFVRLDGDDHDLSLGPTRLRFLQEVEKFLAAHIGN